MVSELGDWALSNTGGQDIEATRRTSKHDDLAQQWVVHHLAEGGNRFKIKIRSAKDGRYLRGFIWRILWP